MPVIPVAPAGAAAAPAPAPAAAAAPSLRFATALERRGAVPTITPTPTATSNRPEVSAVHPERGASAHAEARSRGASTSTPAAIGALSALQRIERAQARLDGVVAAARAGRTFTAAELLALQAEAYRCTQTVDLAAKLVEQGAQAVKHALNTPL